MKILSNKHLSYWKKSCSIEKMDEWCGDYNIRWKSKLRKHIIDKKHKSILDCGAGVFSEYFGFKNDKYKIKYTATEITKKFINFGKKNNIKVDNYLINDLKYNDNSYDCIICYDVLNHQIDYKKEIKELIRVSSKEVIISFFKPFEEDQDFKLALGNTFSYKKSSLGTIQKRYTNFYRQPILIYH